jgi:hypothetical protein
LASHADFKLNDAGMKAILRAPGVQADLRARADRIAAAAGPGMKAESHPTSRARATVWTSTHAARRAEADHHALSRAFDAGRG